MLRRSRMPRHLLLDHLPHACEGSFKLRAAFTKKAAEIFKKHVDNLSPLERARVQASLNGRVPQAVENAIG